jgi:hypothetical protein
MASMPHLVRWHEQLRDFGLVVVGPHCQQATAAQVKAKALSVGVTFTVVASGGVQNGNDFRGIPHCMLFDHTGKCLYRGSPSGVEAPLRVAVGTALVERTGKSDFSKPLAPLVAALKKGQSPMAVLQRLIPLQKSKNARTAEDAKLLAGQLLEGAQQRVEEAAQKVKDDPVTAYEQLSRVVKTFKGTPVAAKATKMLTDLKKDKAVMAEMRARPSMEAIKKLDDMLNARVGQDIDRKGAQFQLAFAATLKQMQRIVQRMKKSWPDARATQEAVKIADRYGVVVK